MHKKWKTLSSKVIYKNKWFYILIERVKRSDNSKGNYYIFKRAANFVVIVALSKERKIILVEEYRQSLKNYIWGLPMGASHKGEDYIKTAKREFLEETGMEAKSWKRIGEFYVGPGHTDVKGIVFLAQNASLSLLKTHGEEGEMITAVKKISIDEFEEMINRGTIKDGPTISAFFLAKKYLINKADK